jgi:hypothetical protein
MVVAPSEASPTDSVDALNFSASNGYELHRLAAGDEQPDTLQDVLGIACGGKWTPLALLVGTSRHPHVDVTSGRVVRRILFPEWFTGVCRRR